MTLKQKLYNFLVKNKTIEKMLKKRRERKHNKMIKTMHKYGYKINDILYSTLKDEFVFYPLCGTLLGLIRENGFIKYDDDMDYGILIDDDKDWLKLYYKLIKKGFKLHHYFENDNVITEMAFRYKTVHVDFFYIDRRNENNVLFYSAYERENITYEKDVLSTMKVPFNYYEGTFEKVINGSTFILPNCYNEFLIANYGENYMTPVKGVVTSSSVGNREFYDDIKTYLKKEEDFKNRFLK